MVRLGKNVDVFSIRGKLFVLASAKAIGKKTSQFSFTQPATNSQVRVDNVSRRREEEQKQRQLRSEVQIGGW